MFDSLFYTNNKTRRRRKSRGGRKTVTEEIRLKPITLERFERGCLLLGVDPDRVRLDLGDAWKDLDWPPLSRMQEFIDLVVENNRLLRLDEMELTGVHDNVGMVAAFFLTESVTALLGVGGIVRTDTKGVGSN